MTAAETGSGNNFSTVRDGARMQFNFLHPYFSHARLCCDSVDFVRRRLTTEIQDDGQVVIAILNSGN